MTRNIDSEQETEKVLVELQTGTVIERSKRTTDRSGTAIISGARTRIQIILEL